MPELKNVGFLEKISLKIKNDGFVRSVIFFCVWMLVTGVLQAIVATILMIISGVDMTNEAALTEWAMNLESNMDFTSLTVFSLSTIGIIGSFITIWFFMTVFNDEPLTNIGLSIKDRGKDMLIGLGAALLFIGGLFLILWNVNAITNIEFVGLKPGVLLVSLTLFIAAFNEEIVFRGYILNSLMDATNSRWFALTASSLLFAWMHGGNPSIDDSWVPMTELFFAGFILGISYTFTKNLWFPTFFHVGWNFFQGLFGFRISGLNVDSWKMIAHQNSGQVDDVISGGTFGIEGSVITLFSTILGTLVIYGIYKYYKYPYLGASYTTGK